MEKESECRLWAIKDPLLTEYHDHEWCKICHDDQMIFELLCLEGQSVGLSWRTIINKRKAYREAFYNFDIETCAKLSDDYLDSLLNNTELIRNKSKLYSIRANAIAVKKIIEQYGSLDKFVWSYTDGKQIVNHWKTFQEVPTQTDISKIMSRDFKKLGIAFVGPVITYSFMQSIGMVNDHLIDCPNR